MEKRVIYSVLFVTSCTGHSMLCFPRLFIPSCFHRLARIGFRDPEEIHGSLSDLSGQLSLLRPASLHGLTGSFSTLFRRELACTSLSTPTAEFHGSGVLRCHQYIFTMCSRGSLLSAT